MTVKGIRIKVGDKVVGEMDVSNVKPTEEEVWSNILSSTVLYQKGSTSELIYNNGLKKRFKVEEPFVFHGFGKLNPGACFNEIYVTIPIALETLKGLGFIKSLQSSKETSP